MQLFLKMGSIFTRLLGILHNKNCKYYYQVFIHFSPQSRCLHVSLHGLRRSQGRYVGIHIPLAKCLIKKSPTVTVSCTGAIAKVTQLQHLRHDSEWTPKGGQYLLTCCDFNQCYRVGSKNFIFARRLLITQIIS